MKITKLQKTYPLYHAYEDGNEIYTVILTGSEVVEETMTLGEYLKRADTKGTREYVTADVHINFILNELGTI